jgi:hypothetical protein
MTATNKQYSSTFPIDGLLFSWKGPARSQVIQNLPKILRFKFKEPMAATWSSDHLTIYHIQHLHLAIANDLSLAMGFTRIDQKVIIMQLGHQFNSYKLIHIQES